MVNLSGGDLGGTAVDGTGWPIGEERVFSGLRYRRDYDDMAVYTGVE